MRVDHIGLGNRIKLNCYLAIPTCQFSYSGTIIDCISCIRNGNGTRVFGGYVND